MRAITWNQRRLYQCQCNEKTLQYIDIRMTCTYWLLWGPYSLLTKAVYTEILHIVIMSICLSVICLLFLQF